MTDVQTDEVRFPQKIDADVTLPDGSQVVKVRVVYRSGILQGIARGEIVIGPTGIVDPGVSLADGGVFVVPTPEGVYLLKKRSGCGCGG